MNRFQPSYGASSSSRAPAKSSSVNEKNVTAATAQQLVDQKLTPPPAEESDYTEYIEYFNKSASALNEVLFGKDPRTAAAIKGAMVKNLSESSKKYAKIPIIGDYFKGKLRTTKAEYNALLAQAKSKDVSESLDLALKAGGLIVGGAALFFVISQIALTRARTRAVSSGY